MKFRAFTICLFACCALATGSFAQRRKAPAARDYFPMRVGDSWTYRMVEGEAEYTLEVMSAEKQANGTTLYLLARNADEEIRWLSKTDGWVLLHRETYPRQEGMEVRYETPRQFLKNPLLPGAAWNWKGKGLMQSEVTETNRVIGPETVRVPAGTFRAMKVISHVSDQDSAVTKTYWYADGVGLVKWMTEGGQIKYGWELVDYSFKNRGRGGSREP